MTYGLEGRCSIQLSYWRRRSPTVGAPGFEPGTSCSQSRRANRTALRPGKGKSYSSGPFASRPAAIARAAARTAFPRWLTAFFRSGGSSPKVIPSSSTYITGS